jgi:hypothetical protein
MSENVNTANNLGGTKNQKSPLNIVVVALVVIIVLLAGGLAYVLLSGGGSPFASLTSRGIDQDIFVVSMDQLVLRPNDMDTRYNIAGGGDFRMNNAQFSHNFGSIYGKPFILNTRRVDGWDITLERANPNDFAPELIRSQVSYHETVDGASAALSKDWFWAYQLDDRAPETFLDQSCAVGDECLSFMYKEAKPGSGAITERYDVAFRHQNVVVWLYIKGQQGEVSEDLALQYAQMVLEKVELLGQ